MNSVTKLLVFMLCFAGGWYAVELASRGGGPGFETGTGPKRQGESGPLLLDERIIPGRFVAPVPRLVDGNPLAIHDAENTILIIYNNGTIFDDNPEACIDYGPPQILTDLIGQEIGGFSLAMFDYCSNVKVGAYRRGQGRRELRHLRRAKDVENLIQSFLDAGMPAEQIFLSGQSEGAWASLLAGRRQEIRFGGMIVFAPSVGGPWRQRGERLWELHREQVAYLSAADRLDALVFGFVGDSYTPARDLAFLTSIDGVSFVPLSGSSIKGIPCREEEPHFIAYRDCFRRTQKPVILSFLQQRLWQLGLAN